MPSLCGNRGSVNHLDIPRLPRHLGDQVADAVHVVIAGDDHPAVVAVLALVGVRLRAGEIDVEDGPDVALVGVAHGGGAAFAAKLVRGWRFLQPESRCNR